MAFRLFGTRFSFSFGFFAVLALYMLCDREGLGIPALAAVALHECGHILIMRLAGVAIPAMDFYPFGIRLEKRGMLPPGREAAVYLGGVAANALAAAATLALWGWNSFAACNAALIAFNLLPVGRLDGGALLRLSLGRRPPRRAELIEKLIGFAILTPLFAAGFWLAARGNYTLLFTACYLALTLLRG